jgi:capsid protein
MAFELKFVEKRPIEAPRTRWFSQILECSKKGRNSWQEVEKEELGKDVEDWKLFVRRPVHKRKAMLEKGKGRRIRRSYIRRPAE